MILSNGAKSVEFDRNLVQATCVHLHDGQVLECDKLVVALGPWTLQQCTELGFPENSIPPITGGMADSCLVQLEDTSASADCFFMNVSIPIDSRTPERSAKKRKMESSSLEVYPRPDNSVYICCGSGCLPSPPLPSCAVDVQPTEGSGKKLFELVGMCSEVIREAKFVKSSACFLPYCSDGLPVIGKEN